MTNILAERGLSLAYVDLDALTEVYPRPANDPFNTGVMLENLKSVWANYTKAGAMALVLARVVEDMDEIEAYEGAIPGAAITIVRLTARPETMLTRLRAREAGSARDWHLARASALGEQLQAGNIGHFVVENEGKGLREVAAEVITVSKWPSFDEQARVFPDRKG